MSSFCSDHFEPRNQIETNDLKRVRQRGLSEFWFLDAQNARQPLTPRYLSSGTYSLVFSLHDSTGVPRYAMKVVEIDDDEISIIRRLKLYDIHCEVIGVKLGPPVIWTKEFKAAVLERPDTHGNMLDAKMMTRYDDRLSGGGGIPYDSDETDSDSDSELPNSDSDSELPNDRRVCCIFMHFYDGTLDSVIGVIPQRAILNIGKQLIEMLECLKNKNMWYTDIKPENIMVKCTSYDNFRVKLGDVGSITGPRSKPTCTYPYPSQRYVRTYSVAYNYWGSIERSPSERMLVWGIVIVMYQLFGENYARDTYRLLDHVDVYTGYPIFKNMLVSKRHIPSFLKAFLGLWSRTEPHDASYFNGDYTLQRLKKDIERQEKYLLHVEMNQ